VQASLPLPVCSAAAVFARFAPPILARIAAVAAGRGTDAARNRGAKRTKTPATEQTAVCGALA